MTSSQVDGGGFSLDVGIGRQDHLADLAALDSFEQALDPEIVGAEVVGDKGIRVRASCTNTPSACGLALDTNSTWPNGCRQFACAADAVAALLSLAAFGAAAPWRCMSMLPRK